MLSFSRDSAGPAVITTPSIGNPVLASTTFPESSGVRITSCGKGSTMHEARESSSRRMRMTFVEKDREDMTASLTTSPSLWQRMSSATTLMPRAPRSSTSNATHYTCLHLCWINGIVLHRSGRILYRYRAAASVARLSQEDDMFGPITLPFGAKMLFNTVQLKPGVSFDDVEMAVGELCSVVKESYGGDKGGFIAGQVFKFSGFLSDKGSLSKSGTTDDHYAIVTYWRSYEDHEKSHADELFNNKFAALATMCSDTKELGYDMLWQGAAGA